MLLEPGEVHRNYATRGNPFFKVLIFPISLVLSLASEHGLSSRPQWKIPDAFHPPSFQALLRFFESIDGQSSGLEQQSRLVRCLDLLLTNCAEKSPREFGTPSRVALHRSREYIDAHFTEKINLKELADIAGLGRFHFLRAFSSEFGLPPHAYQNNMRIARVKTSLMGGVPLSAIEAGFSDQSHLIRSFKKGWSLTPGQYVKMLKKPFLDT